MVYFKLVNKVTHEFENLNEVDELIKLNTKAYDRTNNEKYAFSRDGYQSGYDDYIDFLQDNLSWYVIIGLRLAQGMTYDEIIDELDTLAASYDERIDDVALSILKFLKNNYDVISGYSCF